VLEDEGLQDGGDLFLLATGEAGSGLEELAHLAGGAALVALGPVAVAVEELLDGDTEGLGQHHDLIGTQGHGVALPVGIGPLGEAEPLCKLLLGQPAGRGPTCLEPCGRPRGAAAPPRAERRTQARGQQGRPGREGFLTSWAWTIPPRPQGGEGPEPPLGLRTQRQGSGCPWSRLILRSVQDLEGDHLVISFSLRRIPSMRISLFYLPTITERTGRKLWPR